ncbi:MAG: ABC transporter ATP-binding protein, partial [Balneolaceae bacterium]
AVNSLLLIGAVTAYGVLLFATRQTLIVGSRRIEFDLRNEVIEKLFRLPQRYFDLHKGGETYIRTTEDISRVRDYFGPVIMYNINTITRAGFIITMMLIVSPELTLWALIPLPFLSVFAYWVSGYIHRYQTIIQEKYSDLAGLAQEAFSSIRLVKAYNREDYEAERFEKESDDYRKEKLKLDLVESLFHPTLTALIGSSVLIVVWQGGIMVIDGNISIGNIAEFVIYVAYLTWPIASLGYTLNLFQKSVASWDRIKEVLHEPEQMDTYTSNNITDTNRRLRGDIEFRNVSFTYPNADQEMLKNVNIHIKAGTTVAIVGRTGSGKSTLLQLIPRLYDVTRGTILIDGVDIRKHDLHQLRQQIGFVPQDTFLFSATIRENIAFGDDKDDFETIQAAADHAGILENIMEFENQFETRTGERGITLSGGQKQRIAIARALIRKPQVLIFDDSLSAVDTETENRILTYLQGSLTGVTKLIVSHRISTIQKSDIIYYIEGGEIIEQGTHEELLERDGKYAGMYHRQLLEKEIQQL